MKMLIVRATCSRNIRSVTATARSTQQQHRNFSDDKENDLKLKKTDEKPAEKTESTSSKLNKLLASMQTDDNLSLVRKISIAKPAGKKERAGNEITTADRPNDIFQAVKNVANLVEEAGQRKVTESELLSKLLNHIDDGANESQEKNAESVEDVSLNDLITKMKIDRGEKEPDQNRGQYVRNAIATRQKHQQQNRGEFTVRNDRKREPQTRPHPHTGSVNLFGGEGLGIFKEPTTLQDSPDTLTTWDYLHKRDLKISITHPPSNYFEKMSLWTAQGRVWKFPIDNEQGLDEEAKVDFTEHVFVEQHLEGWCPQKGPIRHFMELVCVGLSKNPYVSAQEKKDHILWYRDYFEQKKDILTELIAQSTETKKSVEK